MGAHIIFILLILLAAYFIFQILRLRLGTGRLESSILAYNLLFLFIWIITEFLSLTGFLSFTGIAISYILFILYGFYFLALNKLPFFNSKVIIMLKRTEFLVLGFSMLIILPILLISIYTPPNNWDSMTYHLGRVMHWAQNGSVEHYPTHISRQLFNPPLTEYFILHLYLLTGSNVFFNIIQLSSLLGCGAVVSSILKIWGYDLKVQLTGFFLTMALPMAILQATNTKNELSVAFFTISCFYYMQKYRDSKRNLNAIFIGITTALALLTKGTSYIYLLPVYMYGFFPINKFNFLHTLKGALLVGSVVGLITFPFYLRNISSYGHPLGSTPDQRDYYKNKTIDLNTLISNIARNSFIHLANDFSFDNEFIFSKKAEFFKKLVLKVHSKLNIDPNNPDTTWGGASLDFFIVRDEDYSGNFLHFMFILLAVPWLLLIKKIDKKIKVYILIVLIITILFCLALKWQPWHSRLHLTIFIMAIPFLAVFTSLMPLLVQMAVVAVFYLNTIAYTYENQTKFVFNSQPNIFTLRRDEIMFSKKGKEVLADYYTTTEKMLQSGQRQVGLILNEDAWDYPFWLFNKSKKPEILIKHIMVSTNSTPEKVLARYPVFIPGIIISTESEGDTIRYAGKMYRLIENTKHIKMYEAE